MNLNIQTLRGEIIESSVQLEKIMTLILCNILEIDNIEDSNSFGRNGNLSFSNKTSLLSDLKYLSKPMKEKISLLYQIRNKFAHELDIDSFVKFFNVFGENKKKSFLKYYPDKVKLIKNEDEEFILSTIYSILVLEVRLYLRVINKHITQDLKNEISKDVLIEKIKIALLEIEDPNHLAYEILKLKDEICVTYPSKSFASELIKQGQKAF